MDWTGFVNHGLEWICKTWTGPDLLDMDWTGFVRHGLDWICKTWTALDL